MMKLDGKYARYNDKVVLIINNTVSVFCCESNASRNNKIKRYSTPSYSVFFLIQKKRIEINIVSPS